jgi:hypothetical protein
MRLCTQSSRWKEVLELNLYRHRSKNLKNTSDSSYRLTVPHITSQILRDHTFPTLWPYYKGKDKGM